LVFLIRNIANTKLDLKQGIDNQHARPPFNISGDPALNSLSLNFLLMLFLSSPLLLLSPHLTSATSPIRHFDHNSLSCHVVSEISSNRATALAKLHTAFVSGIYIEEAEA